MGKKTRWLLGILALALWAGAPYLVGQQTKRNARHAHRTPRRSTTQVRSGAGTPQISNPSVSSSGATATATSVPGSGTPTLENPQPTGDLDTMPNQTLSPGATTVPGNSGGIGPASNDASSGEYTPSEGHTSPNSPGANPSNTQGVPTFSSGAQPLDANLPRPVAPRGATTPHNQSQKPQ